MPPPYLYPLPESEEWGDDGGHRTPLLQNKPCIPAVFTGMTEELKNTPPPTALLTGAVHYYTVSQKGEE